MFISRLSQEVLETVSVVLFLFCVINKYLENFPHFRAVCRFFSQPFSMSPALWKCCHAFLRPELTFVFLANRSCPGFCRVVQVASDGGCSAGTRKIPKAPVEEL